MRFHPACYFFFFACRVIELNPPSGPDVGLGGLLDVSGCVFTSNEAGGSSSGDPNNSVQSSGGAISASTGASVVVRDSLFTSNTASASGGAVAALSLASASAGSGDQLSPEAIRVPGSRVGSMSLVNTTFQGASSFLAAPKPTLQSCTCNKDFDLQFLVCLLNMQEMQLAL